MTGNGKRTTYKDGDDCGMAHDTILPTSKALSDWLMEKYVYIYI